MSIFSKLFGKKEDGGRLSLVERYETSTSRPIIFMTDHGGAAPLGYRTETNESRAVSEEPLALLQQAIEAGVVDEYTDLDVFAEILKQRAVIATNDIKKQTISRKEVGQNIKMQALQGKYIRQRKINELRGERDSLSGARQYEDCSMEFIRKGIGDQYEK